MAKPEALAVVDQELDRRPRPIAECEHGARERVRAEAVSANPHQSVDSASEVHRISRQQYPGLRRQRDQRA